MNVLKEGVVALGMDRRELLTSVGAAMGTASLAGCLSDYRDVAGEVGETTTEGSGETTTRPSASETTTTTATTTATGPTSLAEASLDVLDSGCGQAANEASVGFREADLAVDVSGTIAGSDACHTAKLKDASYDAEADALVLTVASAREEESEVCADCIAEITYEATATFEGGLPGTVEVVHEALNETTTVATADSE